MRIYLIKNIRKIRIIKIIENKKMIKMSLTFNSRNAIALFQKIMFKRTLKIQKSYFKELRKRKAKFIYANSAISKLMMTSWIAYSRCYLKPKNKMKNKMIQTKKRFNLNKHICSNHNSKN